jgi:3-oxoacyl-(acyl-carrier-protein) synthase
MDRKEARKLDPFAQFAMVVADEAILDSKLDLAQINKDRAGVIWGSGIGGLLTFQEEVKSYTKGDGTPRFNPFFIPKMIPDLSAGHISIKYGFGGPNFVTVSACASATNAIYDAFTYIRLGKADIIVSGGSEAAVCEAGIGGFNAMKALSERNDSPESASRPYDKERDGFVLGEGAGALIIEEYEHAIKRGATILGEIVGGGLAADADDQDYSTAEDGEAPEADAEEEWTEELAEEPEAADEEDADAEFNPSDWVGFDVQYKSPKSPKPLEFKVVEADDEAGTVVLERDGKKIKNVKFTDLILP